MRKRRQVKRSFHDQWRKLRCCRATAHTILIFAHTSTVTPRSALIPHRSTPTKTAVLQTKTIPLFEHAWRVAAKLALGLGNDATFTKCQGVHALRHTEPQGSKHCVTLAYVFQLLACFALLDIVEMMTSH